MHSSAQILSLSETWVGSSEMMSAPRSKTSVPPRCIAACAGTFAFAPVAWPLPTAPAIAVVVSVKIAADTRANVDRLNLIQAPFGYRVVTTWQQTGSTYYHTPCTDVSTTSPK